MGQITGGCDVSHIATSPHTTKTRPSGKSPRAPFFDAQDELAARFADHPERYYWNIDMHFNFDGIRAYGELVGRELLRKLEQAG